MSISTYGIASSFIDRMISSSDMHCPQSDMSLSIVFLTAYCFPVFLCSAMTTVAQFPVPITFP